MKNKRATLEHRIFDMIQQNNKNTPHFNYKVNFDEGTITLDLYTYNPLQCNIHFLHTVTENTPVLCLTKMITYLEQHTSIKKHMNPYTITWKLKNSDSSNTNKSYYYEESESVAIEKFFVGKNPDDYSYKIQLNPLS